MAQTIETLLFRLKKGCPKLDSLLRLCTFPSRSEANPTAGSPIMEKPVVSHHGHDQYIQGVEKSLHRVSLNLK